MATMFMIVDSVNNTAVLQPGQPPTTVAAYALDVPDGKTMEDVANEHFVDHRFPLNSAIYLVDTANVTAYVAVPQLTPAPALTG